jgi:proline dehydrogenase
LTWSQALRRRRASAYGAGAGLDAAVDTCRRLAKPGLACTVGYAASPGEHPRSVADVHLDAFDRLAAEGLDGHVSVKLSALDFDPELLAELDAAAARSAQPLHIDALGPETADRTWRLLEGMPRDGSVGVALPGRWRRSLEDTALAARLGLRVRVVKGQWAGRADGDTNPVEGFLAVVNRLRGHDAGVAVATHHVTLLEECLTHLKAAGTPCGAELYFGLPFRAAALAARRLGVPIRVYVAYGATGAPYDARRAARDPIAAWWLLQDLAMGKDKTWVSIKRSFRQPAR